VGPPVRVCVVNGPPDRAVDRARPAARDGGGLRHRATSWSVGRGLVKAASIRPGGRWVRGRAGLDRRRCIRL